MSDVNNGMDIIDSRDVIERIRELEEWRKEALESAKEFKERIAELEAMNAADMTGDEAEELTIRREGKTLWMAEDGTKYSETSDWSEAEEQEWKALKSLEDQCEGYSDWSDGVELIRDSHFKEYAQELAEDIGAIPKDLSWPACHIDWEAAASALKSDYTSVTFDGVDYWVRS